MKDKILDIVSKHTQSIGKTKTLEELAELENSIVNELDALFSLHVVSQRSEPLHTKVFKLANELAINGYGNEAVKMHQICNGM